MAFSGFRGAAPNQSRSASGVYTGLEWWHERDYQERPLAGKFAASVRKAAYVRTVDMPPPRSLGRWRSGRETAAGGSCSFRTDHGTDTAGAQKKEPRKRPRRCRFSIGSASP
ncbi:hypothetical protein DQ657_26440 [Salmonella enterica]|nr:hypothetical protein [Salmonella enterica]